MLARQRFGFVTAAILFCSSSLASTAPLIFLLVTSYNLFSRPDFFPFKIIVRFFQIQVEVH